MTFKVFH